MATKRLPIRACWFETAFKVFVDEKSEAGKEIMDKVFPYFLQAHSMEFSN